MSEEEKKNSGFYIHKSRNLVALFRDAFFYMSDDARLLLQGFFAFAFPLIIGSYTVAYYYLNTTPEPHSLLLLKQDLPKPYVVALVICCLAFIVGFCVLSLLTNRLILIKDKRDQITKFEFKDLAKNMQSDIKTYVFNFLIVYFIYYFGTILVNYLSTIYIFTEYGDMNADPISEGLDWLIRFLPRVVILPLLMYFGFAALFISVRDNKGSSDVLKNIFELSKTKLKKIWVYCFVVLLIAYLSDAVLSGFFRGISGFFPFNNTFLFFVWMLQKIISLGILMFMQVAVIMLLGSIEEDLEGHYIRNKIEEL